jgi:hypothetical protein
MVDTKSPRAWAFTLLGIHEYTQALGGDRRASQIRDDLIQRLIGLFHTHSSPNWIWFENSLSYANARLSQVLIQHGRCQRNTEALHIGLSTLKWLSSVQESGRGQFRPIGSAGFFEKGGERAQFDQQPIEAHSTVSACLEAYRSTKDTNWHVIAHSAFDWFLGKNDLNQPLYDPKSGGCRDGLHVDRVNQNQGAESTLAFLISLAEMKGLETELELFNGSSQIPQMGVTAGNLEMVIIS